MLLEYGIVDAPANMGAASKLLDALLGNKRRRVCDAFAPKTPATSEVVVATDRLKIKKSFPPIVDASARVIEPEP
jgi:hypothetical protein